MAERTYIENLARSLVWNSTLGLFGLDSPDEDLREWQAENPKMNLATELVPLGFGTVKAMSALAKTPKYGAWAKGLAKAEKVAEHPFLAKAAQETALLAPVEFGRQAIGYGIQEATGLEGDSLGERALTATLDTGFGGLVGGTIGLISSAGKRVKLPQQLAELSAADSWQQNLRKARQVLRDTADPEVAREVENVVWKLERQIKEGARQNMVSSLGDGSDNVVKNLNSIFRGTHEIKSRMLSMNRDFGFSSLKELDATMKDLKATGVLPDDWLEYSQFPRLVSASSESAAKRVDIQITNALPDVGEGWKMAKEKDGLYVLARKTGKNGQWFVTKTDNPGKFVKNAGQLQTVVEKTAWRDPDTIYKPTGDAENILDKTLKFNELLNVGVSGAMGKEGTLWQAGRKGVKELGKALGLGDLAESELAHGLADFSKRYFAPTVFKFKNHPLARKIYAVAQNTLDNGRKRAQELIYGRPEIGKDSLFRVVAGGIKRDDPTAFANRLRQLAKSSPAQFDAFLDVIDRQIPYEEVLVNPTLYQSLGKEGIDTLKALVDLHDTSIKELFSTASELHIPDDKLFPLRKGHYGVSHYWNGSLRQGILNEKGNLVYIVGGENRKGIKKLAEGVIEEAKKEGRDWRLGEYWTKERNLDLRQEKLLAADEFSLANEFAARYSDLHPGVHQASFFRPRSGVGGYNTAKTVEEFIQNLSYSLENKYIWMANEINQRVLAKDIATLGIDNPRVAAMLEDTLDALEGRPGVFSQLVNKTADSILAPVLGTDSASKIVRAVNRASVHLDLGFGNLAYGLANILQPITTVLPHLSLLRECPAALQWAYDGVPLISKSGKGMQVNTLSPLKMMWEGLRLMGNPKLEEGFSDFLEQMVRDGVLSPRFIESYIGENSGFGKGLMDSFKAKDFSGMVLNMSTMLPSFSEQASRGYALSVGYKYFNSLAKAGMLSKDQVYSAARKFTENTMFQFAASDRARILQGPVGNAWGLFKNWTMHYVGWQMQYMEAGLKYGAWKPYMYSNLATSLLGGMGSSEIGASLERFTEWATGDKMSNLLYDRWGDGAGSSFLLYGIPGAFGLSLQSQVNSPFRDPGEETQRFMGFVWGNRLKYLWNSLDSAIDYYATTGKNPANDQNFQREILRALAPKMFYRTAQTVGDTLYSLSGSKLLDLSPIERMAYTYFNLPSTRIDQALSISNAIWKDKEKRGELTSRYSEVMTNALQNGDGRLMYRILQRGLADGVDLGGVMDGANKRLENRYLTPLERNTDYYGVWGSTAGALGI